LRREQKQTALISIYCILFYFFVVLHFRLVVGFVFFFVLRILRTPCDRAIFCGLVFFFLKTRTNVLL